MPAFRTARSFTVTLAALTCLATLSGAGSAGAQPASTTAPAASAAAVHADDRRFIEKAGMDGMAEVTLGKLAQARSADAQVKAFGEQMVQDHGKSGDELARLAAAKGVQIPPPDREHKKNAEQLGKKSGADFDKAYMKHMVEDHKKAIKLFEKGARSAKDADVRAFASKTLPTLQAHLQHAEKTRDAVK